jgi:hypothetical protein
MCGLAYIPVLRILGGVFFLLAGVFFYYKIGFVFSFPILLVTAGAVVMILALAKHRPTGGDIALFVIGLLVFGGVTSTVTSTAGPILSFTATTSQVHVRALVVKLSSNFSSVRIMFSNKDNLVYQLNFTGIAGFFPVPPKTNFYNETRGDALFLNASSTSSEISMILGEGYTTNITASTGAGSISVTTLGDEHLGRVSLSSGAGSISADLPVNSIGGLEISTGAGSIDLKSSRFVPALPGVPVSLSSGAGSASINVAVPSAAGVEITGSTGIGTINNDLPGFSVTSSYGRITATAGNLSATNPSFQISVSTGAGSLSLEAHLIP